jgi:hypothetical protein
VDSISVGTTRVRWSNGSAFGANSWRVKVTEERWLDVAFMDFGAWRKSRAHVLSEYSEDGVPLSSTSAIRFCTRGSFLTSVG